MLEDKDIQKLKEELAIKEDLKDLVTKEDTKRFATKENLEKISVNLLNEIFATQKNLGNFKEEMQRSFSDLQSSVDTYAKKADSYFQEMVMLSHQVNRHEGWIKQIADKLGVKLEY